MNEAPETSHLGEYIGIVAAGVSAAVALLVAIWRNLAGPRKRRRFADAEPEQEFTGQRPSGVIDLFPQVLVAMEQLKHSANEIKQAQLIGHEDHKHIMGVVQATDRSVALLEPQIQRLGDEIRRLAETIKELQQNG